MQWKFSQYSVDKNRAELIGPKGPIHIERFPLDLLIHLIENADHVVSRDDLIEAVWGGRIVSDATISTAVKQARRAVGDDGAVQAIIKTVHGRGFRFVAELIEPSKRASPAAVAPIQHAVSGTSPIGSGRPSLAVLKFQQFKSEEAYSGLATAFPTELIASLSRMRWLHVISRGSSFQFDPESFSPQDVGDKLGVRYLLTGSIEIIASSLTISVELQTIEDGALIWSDRFTANLSDIQRARHDITASVISALEIEVPQYEAAQTHKLNKDQLDAWSHFHLGLTHIYKFQQQHNQIAAEHFTAALASDPQFARAHAGLSFTHWQNAFMHFGDDRATLINLASGSAERALDIDPSDPFANFNMGRARWLEGDTDGSEHWLERALRINPNFAQCHYNKGLILTLNGSPGIAQTAAMKAMSLSPLDPLYYGMLGVRAMCQIAMDDFDEASHLSEQAMQSPGAHFYIALIAAAAHELGGDKEGAVRWRDLALRARPDLTSDMFLAAFPFQHAEMRSKMRNSLKRLGLP